MAQNRRRGSAYITVLGTAVAITVIGLSGIMVSRIRLRRAEAANDFATARAYARSAVEMGFYRIENNDDWRSTFASGVWEADKTIGDGTYTLIGVDPADNNLADNDLEPVELTGVGRRGAATFQLRVTLLAELRPLGCLTRALQAGSDISFTSSTLNTDAPVHANLNITALTATINADVEAAGLVSGATFNRSITSLAEPHSMPNADVFDPYIAKGTTISYGALPSGTIENVLLGPTNNPYGGPLNSEGIYVINCGGQRVTIKNCRIYGTLVLLDPANDSRIEASVVWGPVIENYPSLLVRGNMNIGLDTASLNEGDLGINLNPFGAPYDGVTDSMIDDTYPSRLSGLYYVEGSATFTDNTNIHGLLVAGAQISTVLSSTLTVAYDGSFAASPPPGFYEPPTMVVADRSWRQVVD